MKIFITVSIITILVFTGCGQQRNRMMNGAEIGNQDAEPIKIGFIGPLSGDQAIIGEENLRGVQIAIGKINKRGGIGGNPLELVVQDDQFNEKETLNAYQKLVTIDGIKYVFAATYGGFLSLAEQAQRDGVLVVETLDTSEELAGIGENMFAIGIYDESIGFAIADYLNAQGVQKAGALILEDPFTSLVEGALQNRFHGTLSIEKYTPDTRDYRTTLTKLSSFDHLVVIGWEEVGRVVRQARELGNNATIVGIDTMASEDFRANTGGKYNGLLFTFWKGSMENPLYRDLLTLYEEDFKKKPENVVFLSTGYDAANILAQSLQGCEGKLGCVRENMRNVRGYRGATGVVNMDEDQITRSVRETLHTYQDDMIVSVK